MRDDKDSRTIQLFSSVSSTTSTSIDDTNLQHAGKVQGASRQDEHIHRTSDRDRCVDKSNLGRFVRQLLMCEEP